jgi:TPR repeat protein
MHTTVYKNIIKHNVPSKVLKYIIIIMSDLFCPDLNPDSSEYLLKNQPINIYQIYVAVLYNYMVAAFGKDAEPLNKAFDLSCMNAIVFHDRINLEDLIRMGINYYGDNKYYQAKAILKIGRIIHMCYNIIFDIAICNEAIGTPRTNAKCIKQLTECSDHGYIKAHEILGEIYLKGRIVPRDIEKSYSIFSRGIVSDTVFSPSINALCDNNCKCNVRADSAICIGNMGILHLRWGIKNNDTVTGFNLLLRSANMDSNRSSGEIQHAVGYCYQMGIGTEQNLIKAQTHYKLAVKEGYAQGYEGLADVYSILGIHTDLIEKYYRYAVSKGFGCGYTGLAILYINKVKNIDDIAARILLWKNIIDFLQSAIKNDDPRARKMLIYTINDSITRYLHQIPSLTVNCRVCCNPTETYCKGCYPSKYVFYCSLECQKHDWTSHLNICKAIQARKNSRNRQ